MHTCVLHADAFVTLHGTRRPANHWLLEWLRSGTLSDSTNGWGAVFLAGPVRIAFRSQAPSSLLTRAAPTKAYIFWLEATAQILAILCICPLVSGHMFCFVDNVAAEHALQKRCSKDPSFTRLLGSFWSCVAPKSHNISFHGDSPLQICPMESLRVTDLEKVLSPSTRTMVGTARVSG